MVKVYHTKVFPSLEEDTFFAHMNKIEEERRKKILAGRSEKARLCSLTAGCLLHTALCRELQLDEKGAPAFQICYGQNGKPFLKEYSGLYFNLSHSGEIVCCAVGTIPVGVDIQEYTRVRDGIAGRFFTEADNELLRQCKTDEDRRNLFFRIWSIRESYIKYTGKGMAQGLDSFEIDWGGSMILPLTGAEKEKPQETAYFTEMTEFSGYSACVCTDEPLSKVHTEEIFLKG